MKIFIPSFWQLVEDRGTVIIASESDPHKQYYVGLRSLKCSCPQAAKGHICKHARWVHSHKEKILHEKQGGLFAFYGG